MKTTRNFSLLAGAACAALWLGGCGTPEARIQKHPEIIGRLAPGQLELIKQGRVGVGFNMEMVRLAVGEPDHVRMRTTPDNRSNEIWSYATYESRDGHPLYRGLYHRYFLSGNPDYPYYKNFPERREKDSFRLVFRDDKVISIETDPAVAAAN